MTWTEKHASISSTSGVLRCPRCRKVIGRTKPSTKGTDIVVPCFQCKVNWIININQNPQRSDIDG